jgi:prephenate dehydratase
VDPDARPERIAYLGPAGTFTEAALDGVLAARSVDGRPPAEKVPMATVGRCFDAVRGGEVDAAVVPIENSLEGGVNATLDALSASDPPLVVVGEELVPVTFVLAACPGTTLDAVRRIASHPHAEAQCRAWLADHLPHVAVEPAMSTAAAAAGLVSDGEAPYDAAICAPAAVERYGLDALAEDIGDRPATTRFVVVARPGRLPEPTGADRTSLVAYLRENHSGALLELLEQFAARGVDLTRIESRPTGAGFGEYCFSLDLDGHVAEPRVAEALKGLRRLSPYTRFLGSYAKADGRPTRVLDWTGGGSFSDAERWLTDLLGD